MLFLFHFVTCYLTVRWLILKGADEALEAVGGIVADLSMKPSCFGFLGCIQRKPRDDSRALEEIEREDADSAHRWSSCIPTRKTRTSRTSFPTEHQCTVRTFR